MAKRRPNARSARGGGDALGKLKTLFAQHVEKLLLGAMALVALLLVYSGFSKESLDTDPERVRAEINRAQGSINSSTWAEVKQERQPEPDRFDQQATQDTISIDLASYAMNTPLHPRMQEQSKRRSDPDLLAPFDLEVKPGYGAIAIKLVGREANIAGLVDRNSPDTRPLPPGVVQGRGETRLGGNYEGRFFVAITGLVPYKKQFDLYVEAFKGAAEYDGERDVPQYLGLMIERAELQPDGSLGPWQTVDTIQGMLREPTTWEGREEERASRDYVLSGLTMPLPPLVLRDISQWAHHSSVPLVRPEDVGRGEGGRAEGGREAEGQATETDAGGPSWLNRGGPSGGEERGRSARGAPSETAAVESGDYRESAVPLLNVDNGMLRYFDFTAQPGKAYQYRVQALLDDPNNPAEGPKPSISSCETDVVVRRQAATEPFRHTPWSEPSQAVFVPSGEQVLASSATAASTIAVGPNRRVRVERKATDEPTIKVLTLTWKNNGPYDVAVPIDVARGAVLNGSIAKAEAIDPTVGRVRILTDYQYVTNAMVLDIYGGFPLGGDLAAPGFMLVRTADGRLDFHAEMDEVDQVERNTIPPDEEEMLRADEPRVEEGGPVEEPPFEGGGEDGGRRNNRRNRRGSPPR